MTFNEKPRSIVERSNTAAKRFAKTRPQEAAWSVGGVTIGALVGLLVGGVGIAAMGGAVGIPAALIFAVLGGLVGNRIGSERDRRSERGKRELPRKGDGFD